MGSFHAVNSLFMGVLYTVTVVGGGYFVAQGTLEVTDLAIYALYIGIFISPVEQLINFTETLQKGYAGFRRFMEVLAETPSVVDAPVRCRSRSLSGSASSEGRTPPLARFATTTCVSPTTVPVMRSTG